MEVNTVDYLTNDLQVADLSEQNLDQLNELHGEWKKLDLLIGANYFFNFIEPSRAKRINSGFYLSLITRLRDEPKLLQSYDNTIREQLAYDMIEEITPEMDQEGIIIRKNEKSRHRPRFGVSANRSKVLLQLKHDILSFKTIEAISYTLGFLRIEIRDTSNDQTNDSYDIQRQSRD
uniref:Uncharacterized protein n=1 Tax=Wuchereria bancrofti TaxID=6293 RepID=A0AAF5Q6K2_WUCBA